jgi:hypothetical protein
MFAIKIRSKNNRRSTTTCVVKHLSGSASGSVQILKMFSMEPVLSFNSTIELNQFLKAGNDTFEVVKIDRPRVYFCNRVNVIFDGAWFWCQASVWPEGEDSASRYIFSGPKRTSKEEAQKAFWFLWNHGTHDYKTDEGTAARLVRLQQGYEEVIV